MLISKLPELEIDKLSDKELIALALANQDDFIYLVNRYREKLARYIRRLTIASSEDVEDILQDIFLKVYLNLNEFDESLQFSSWIYRIAHNQVISRHRKIKARPEGYSVEIDEGIIERLKAEIDIIDQVDDLLNRQKVADVLAGLDAKYRDILVLRFFEEKNYQELSDILRKPAGTIASLLNKSKEEFKKLFISQVV